jgi:hypothetical protein
VTGSLEALKREVAVQRGLGVDAARFLSGEALDQIEQSAAELSALVEMHGRQQPEPAQVDPITAALASKAQQKRALAETILGRPQQARDERGRYTSRTVSFDGGARGSTVQPPRDVVREHDEVIGRLARIRALGA